MSFFRQSGSDNKQIKGYNPRKIFSKLLNIPSRSLRYYSQEEVYREYCNLLKSTSQKASEQGLDIKIYQFEMCLFSMAVNEAIRGMEELKNKAFSED